MSDSNETKVRSNEANRQISARQKRQADLEKLWKLKQKFRLGYLGDTMESDKTPRAKGKYHSNYKLEDAIRQRHGFDAINWNAFPGIDDYSDLGHYEFVVDKWVFKRRPRYTVSDQILTDVFAGGRLFSVMQSHERADAENQVEGLNKALDRLFDRISDAIAVHQEYVNESWEICLTDEKLKDVGVDSKEVHLSSIIGVNELLSRPREKPEILIEQLLAKGWVSLLAGASKSYKSWLALQLALAASKGDAWLGFQCKRSRVLYVDYELSHASISNRMVKLWKAQNPNVASESFAEDYLRAYGVQDGPDFLVLGHSFNKKNQIAVILDSIRRKKDPETAFIDDESTADAEGEVLGGRHVVKVEEEDRHLYSDVYDLIIIDPLYMLLAGRDENSSSEMVDVFKEIRELQSCTGAAILIVTHFRKGPRDWRTSSSDRISGSGVFTRYPDLVLTLSRVAEGIAKAKQKGLENKYSLDVTARHLKGWDRPIGLTRHDCIFRRTEKGETEVILSSEIGTRGPKKKIESLILKHLRDNKSKYEGKPVSEIIKIMEGHKSGKFKRSSLYKFFQTKSDAVSISGRRRVVTLPFAERNKK